MGIENIYPYNNDLVSLVVACFRVDIGGFAVCRHSLIFIIGCYALFLFCLLCTFDFHVHTLTLRENLIYIYKEKKIAKKKLLIQSTCPSHHSKLHCAKQHCAHTYNSTPQ